MLTADPRATRPLRQRAPGAANEQPPLARNGWHGMTQRQPPSSATQRAPSQPSSPVQTNPSGQARSSAHARSQPSVGTGEGRAGAAGRAAICASPSAVKAADAATAL